MLNLNRKILTLLTMINIHIMHYKLLHKFLQTIKCCFQVQVQATSLLKRNKHWNAFRVWLYEKHLVHLCGYPTHQGSRKKSLWKKKPETLNLTLSLTWHRCGKNPPGKSPWELFSGGDFFLTLLLISNLFHFYSVFIWSWEKSKWKLCKCVCTNLK